VLQIGDNGDLGVVEASDRVTEAGEFIALDWQHASLQN
jgi:hypothetical protein